MIKNVFGRKFSRTTNQRKSLFKSLISSLILDERIKTTLEKAKAIKADVDKIVNKAKKTENAIHFVQPHIAVNAVDKLIKDIAPRFNDRTSGYTRIIRIGRRFSDNAQMALMEWVIKSQSSNLKAQNLGVKELPEGKIEKKISAKKEVVKSKPKQKETKRKAAKK